MPEKIFALDIGTHSVVGIIIEKKNDSFHVLEVLTKEHTERAMLDGQIHDVISVSSIISEIKEALEIKHGPLSKVCVAAAGRALKTERAVVSIDINGKPMMEKEDILHLELSAVQQAQSQVADSANEHSYNYYCVGYSVLFYRLDGHEIGNLIDQSGSEASAEIIATFLPKVVVESLMAALKRADLEMQALTLEPIAAINVLIPPSMRRLNVALVDIGAGTSDIALTDMGTVIAYGMVPVAGDEITEAISDQFLLDFPLAEQTKRKLSEAESIKVTDILGFETEIFRGEAIKLINPSLNRLADTIKDEIYNLNNHKPPKAVMLVGGGSLTPELPKLLADKLNLPENRIAIRGTEAISQLTFEEGIHKGPELVTPIGIAMSALNNPVQYISVVVNGQTIRLFDMKKLTVGDCLLASGMKFSKLYGKPGMAIMASINNQWVTIPGFHGSPPSLFLNGKPCAFNTEVNSNDSILIEKGMDGKPPVVKISEILDDIPRKTVTINGTKYIVEAIIKQNGIVATGDELVLDRDEIVCRLPDTIESLLQALKLNPLFSALQPFKIKINHKFYMIERAAGKLFKNGIEAKAHSLYDHNDEILIDKSEQLTVREVAESLNILLDYSIMVTFNEKKILLKKEITEFYRGEEKLSDQETLNSGEELRMVQRRIEPFIFQDIFNAVHIDMPPNPKSRFLLLKNNEETAFHEKIEAGDELKLFWPAAQSVPLHLD
ncbi:cell division protein FtsA [Peribacillus deserti]|uniref:Cell division protein FtsA n=1 Tax=Peribacillus deserti TaxID=673318 RepID=A0ABS2QIF2_9BACI|nr:cell division FtsA domain-containing protein [Peribacillus deserti]MBM7692923.1 cell division protein FtsA [Peribacillus deserti]